MAESIIIEPRDGIFDRPGKNLEFDPE